MALIFWRKADALKEAQVTEENPFPVSIILGDPDGATEYLGDASMPVAVTNTPTVAPAVRMRNVTFQAAAAGDYSAADVVSFSVTAGNNGNAIPDIVAVPGGVAILDEVQARSSNAALRWRLRLHLYGTTPLTADVELRDNVAADWSKTSTGATNYLGFVDLPAMAARGSNLAHAQSPNLRQEIKCPPSQTGCYYVVETLDAEANEAVNQSMSFDFYFLD